MLIFVLIILFLFTLSVFKLFILAIKMIKPFFCFVADILQFLEWEKGNLC